MILTKVYIHWSQPFKLGLKIIDSFEQIVSFITYIYIFFLQTVPCYRTKFSPVKKETKQSKTLSDNIKKFLARKEEEEKHKALEEKRKKDVSL